MRYLKGNCKVLAVTVLGGLLFCSASAVLAGGMDMSHKPESKSYSRSRAADMEGYWEGEYTLGCFEEEAEMGYADLEITYQDGQTFEGYLSFDDEYTEVTGVILPTKEIRITTAYEYGGTIIGKISSRKMVASWELLPTEDYPYPCTMIISLKKWY